jgi:hypothetical protein
LRTPQFDEICQHAATGLGYDDFSTLSRELKERVPDEAEELTEQWDEEVECLTTPSSGAKRGAPESGLWTLLAARQELGERILVEEKVRLSYLFAYCERSIFAFSKRHKLAAIGAISQDDAAYYLLNVGRRSVQRARPPRRQLDLTTGREATCESTPIDDRESRSDAEARGRTCICRSP